MESSLSVSEFARRLEDRGVPLNSEDIERLRHRAIEHNQLHDPSYNNTSNNSISNQTSADKDPQLNVHSLCSLLDIPLATNDSGKIGKSQISPCMSSMY